MQIHAKSTILLLSALTLTGPVMAQSSIQCAMGANGVMEAALVWRNTLGADRANALCRSAPAPASVAIQQASYPSQYAAAAMPEAASIQYQPLFAAQPPREEEYVALPR